MNVAAPHGPTPLHTGRRIIHGFQAAKERLLSTLVPDGARVLEVGRRRDAHTEGTFDYIVLDDVLLLDDIQGMLHMLRTRSHSNTRLVLLWLGPAWQWLLDVAAWMGLHPLRPHNWLNRTDIRQLCDLASYEIVDEGSTLASPFKLPVRLVGLNEGLRRTRPRGLDWLHYCVCRPLPLTATPCPWSATVVVPTRNEAGHVESAVTRIPEMGSGTEIIFVDGGSDDGTPQLVERMAALHPHRRIRLIRQTVTSPLPTGAVRLPQGKGDALRLGFEAATGDVLMVLDGDLTVSPEVLPRFFDALTRGKGDLINGNRMTYPMERGAMRFVNWWGNRILARLCSWLLSQYIKDGSCGTKVLWRRDYERIRRQQPHTNDQWGDYDLLFGAAACRLRILNLPVRYLARRYGVSKIVNLKDAPHLFLLAWQGFCRVRSRRRSNRWRNHHVDEGG